MEIAEFHERLKKHCKYNGDLDDCRACWFRRYCFTNKNEMTKETIDEALLRFSQPSETAIAERLEEIKCSYDKYVATVEIDKTHYQLLARIACVTAIAAIVGCGTLTYLLLHCI